MDMNIKGVEKEFVVQAKIAALKSGMTLRDWVVEVLSKAAGRRETDGLVRKSERQATGAKPDGVKHVAPTGTRVETEPDSGQGGGIRAGASDEAPAFKQSAKCGRCGNEVSRDPKNPKYWICPKGRCGRQLDASEVKL